ncbi:hypothetical protein [Achromobacter arsenitoxydans]|uniref:Uncharacterized protein n=1 Tax=Achromobacter arsenitoxydans SY8 TaxID=477184 RepID=H0FAS9_9BURK|nr:hypothetical protein [Achromobacter arsenitoxydans]EHK64597.1 hypothetical protein KYC_19429 [Achromobacter arsenitoxydans SY8]
MSGFLRQLADRSLGLAPRMRSAAALSPVRARDGFAVVDTGQDASPAVVAQRASVHAPAPPAGLETLDRWARLQPSLAPQAQTTALRARGPGRDAPMAADAPLARATAPRPASRQVFPEPSTESADPRPRTFMPRADAPDSQARKAGPPTGGVQAALRALQAQGVGEPVSTRPDAAPALADRSELAEDAAPAASVVSMPVRARTPERDAPVSRPAPARQATPDIHITIDRLEVAPPAPAPRAASPARTAALSLRAYLAARRTGLP